MERSPRHGATNWTFGAKIEPSSQRRGGPRAALRSAAVIASFAALLCLAACGGSGDSGVTFDIGIVVAGQPVNGVAIQPGGAQNITISAGQFIELDASESVVWTLEVGGSRADARAPVEPALHPTASSPPRAAFRPALSW